MGYDRAAFFEMLRVLASDPILSFAVCDVSEDRKTWQKKSIVRYLERNADLTDEEKTSLEHMREVKDIAESPARVTALFEVSDVETYLRSEFLGHFNRFIR